MNPIEILLVEDSEGDILLTKKALERGKINNNLYIARDGEEAIQYLKDSKNTRPDLILLDLNLPRIDGREVLKMIKSTDSIKRIPVIILTTSDSEKDILDTYDSYANGYIVKPVDMSQFFGVVSQIENFWFTVVKLPQK